MDPVLFYEDKQPSRTLGYEDLLNGGASLLSKASVSPKAEPLWHDVEDDGLQVSLQHHSVLKKLRTSSDECSISGTEYGLRLRVQHERLRPTPAWASKLAQSHVPVRLQDAAVVSRRVATALPEGIIDMTSCRNPTNSAAPSASVVNSLQFHENDRNLLVGGPDKTLRLFGLADAPHDNASTLLAAVTLADLPISMARFGTDGRVVFAAGRRPFYYKLDLSTGVATKILGIPGLARRSSRTILSTASPEERSLERFFVAPKGDLMAFTGAAGHVHVVSQTHQRLVQSLKMNQSARCLAFTPDGWGLYGIGDQHELYKWDLRHTARCLFRLADPSGGQKAALLSLAPCGRLLAIGAASGAVSLYDTTELEALAHAPDVLSTFMTPRKTLLHLTTHVNCLAFNSDAQILAMASRSRKNALRLVHVPSMTVFSNWPLAARPCLSYVNALAFSPSSRHLAIGNDRGAVHLFSLRHYAP